MAPPTDADALTALLAKVAQGDRAALAALYHSTSAKLLGVTLRILRDRSESEDVLQEVYITVWRRAGSFDASRGVSPITWLATIARNRAIDRVRARGPQLARSAPEAAGAAIADAGPLADAQVESDQEAARLHRCLSELEPRTAGAIRTAFFEGVAYEALAQRLGEPVGTVKSWIRRGLLRLRGCLDA